MLMMIFIILVMLCLFVCAFINLNGGNLEEGIVSIFLCFIIGVFFLISPLWISFDNYVDMKKTYEATISQYRSSIEMYEDKAVIDVDKSSFTDFKYAEYQENISNMIKDLRSKVTEYNETYIGKQEYAKNSIFSWYITGPSEDMKMIELKTGGGMKN